MDVDKLNDRLNITGRGKSGMQKDAIYNSIMNATKKESVVGVRGPRTAGLAEYRGFTGDIESLRSDGNWNLNGDTFNEFPVDKLIPKMTDPKGKLSSKSEFSTMKNAGLKLGSSSKKLNDIAESLPMNLRADRSTMKSLGNINATGGVETFTNRDRTGKVSLSRLGVLNADRDTRSRNTAHEMQHVVTQGWGGMLSSAKDFTDDITFDYGDQKTEGVSYLMEDRWDMPDSLGSNKSKYGIHPFVGRQSTVGFIDRSEKYLDASFARGDISQKERIAIEKNIDTELNRLNKMYSSDPKFKALVDKYYKPRKK